ncbi:MAG: PQQ-binding-like beta-propeller repeat protein [Mariprofundaceae bacterium]|nr:PQQ-binding-like beta-propeller repeat protein [Mariprofundaceae bacterium]
MKHYFLNLPVWIASVLILAACVSAPEVQENTSAMEKTTEEAPVAAAPVNLDIAWVVDVDQRRPMSPFGYSQPALAGDKIVIGARDARVRVYDLHGNELRRIAIEAACESGTLALNPGLVVLGDVNGTLYGINPQTGRILWRQRLSSVMLGHPVKAGNDFMVQTADNRIYRFSSKGEKRWSFAGQPGGLTLNTGAAPRVFGDVVYAIFTNGDVVALRADSGDLIWRRQLLLDTSAVTLSEMKVPVTDPVLAGDVLIVSFYQGNLIALSVTDGRQLWQRQLSLKSTPIVQDGRLLAATSHGAMVSLDVSNGETLWLQKLSEGELVGPALSQGRLFAGDDHGHVYALASDGRKIGMLNLPGRMDRAPVAAPDGILIRNSLGGLYLIQ